MSVHVTLRVEVDPAAFEAQVASDPQAIDRIVAVAQRSGLVAHRWSGSDGERTAVHEWPDAETFQAFLEEAGPEIRPLMQSMGMTSPPEAKVWRGVDLDDTFGRGA